METKRTKRGFALIEFKDYNNEQCSVQKSSLATEHCIWLGVDDADPQVMSSDAIRMGLRKSTNDERDNGWVKFDLPPEVLLTTRMHLTRKQVKSLIPILQKFVQTGALPNRFRKISK